ncbi:hypothetical protein [Nocardia lasii]|uniref:DUF8020 domain-containing protein n=1 Tax=Nocardia lasii TaxID=1616107 RepID=A0ABW1JK44_9NOCA
MRLQDPVSGRYKGIDYSIKHTTDKLGSSITVPGKAFALNAAGDKVLITNPSGVVVDKVPLKFTIADQDFGMTPTISDGGKTLQLKITEKNTLPPQPISALGWSMGQVESYDTEAELVAAHPELAKQIIHLHATDFAAGALIGGAVGFVLTLPAFGVGALVGAPIGGVIGLFVGHVVRDLMD